MHCIELSTYKYEITISLTTRYTLTSPTIIAGAWTMVQLVDALAENGDSNVMGRFMAKGRGPSEAQGQPHPGTMPGRGGNYP